MHVDVGVDNRGGAGIDAIDSFFNAGLETGIHCCKVFFYSGDSSGGVLASRIEASIKSIKICANCYKSLAEP